MSYNREETLARVYAEMAEGKSVTAICAAKDMPETSTIYLWLIEEGKSDEYARAKEARADRMADEIVEIADDSGKNADDRRIAIDARKWRAGKLHGKYSDKVKHVGGDSDDAPIRTEGTTTLDIGGLNDSQLRALASIRIPTE